MGRISDLLSTQTALHLCPTGPFAMPKPLGHMKVQLGDAAFPSPLTHEDQQGRGTVVILCAEKFLAMHFRGLDVFPETSMHRKGLFSNSDMADGFCEAASCSKWRCAMRFRELDEGTKGPWEKCNGVYPLVI